MCKCVLPPGVNSIAVDKYTNININNCVVNSQLETMLLTLILLTWRIWRAPNNASKWQMGFNLVSKELKEAH
jgi:hypothetical protein